MWKWRKNNACPGCGNAYKAQQSTLVMCRMCGKSYPPGALHNGVCATCLPPFPPATPNPIGVCKGCRCTVALAQLFAGYCAMCMNTIVIASGAYWMANSPFTTKPAEKEPDEWDELIAQARDAKLTKEDIDFAIELKRSGVTKADIAVVQALKENLGGN